MVFAIVFFVTLFVDVVPGLLAGVFSSWFLALTLPYEETPVLRVLRRRLGSEGSVNKAEGAVPAEVELVDGFSCAPELGYPAVVCLLELRVPLMFSNSVSVQVRLGT
jgi:hypothetical protein